ncbi:MAG TPA: ABC transporter permease [Bryobacteraceae bacterium]|nr:ABC transporter permease [Bryobacteraceae bacterium]
MRVLAQARKEITQVLRDKLALALALVLPLILMVLMSTAISLTPTGMPVGVRDYDNSPGSRNLIAAIDSSLTLRVRSVALDVTPEKAFSAGLVRAIVIIPEHFGRDISRHRPVTIQALVDATDTNTATQMRGFIAQIVQASAPVPRQGVLVETRLFYNPGRESQRFYGPGAFVFVLSIFPPLLAALAMSRENEQRTIVQVYVSSISALEYLLGKVLAFMAVTAGAWICALATAMTVFGLRFAGDPTPFLVGSALYLFTSVSFGVMVGSALPSQAVAVQVVSVVGFLSSFLLSGFIFPVQNIPPGLRWISYFVQARYFIEVSRDAFLQGGGWPAVGWHVGMIAIIGAAFFAIAWRSKRYMQVSA